MLTIRPGYDNGPERSHTAAAWLIALAVVALVLVAALNRAPACAGGAAEIDRGMTTTIVVPAGNC